MAKATVSDADFLALFRKHGPTKTAARLGVTKRAALWLTGKGYLPGN